MLDLVNKSAYDGFANVAVTVVLIMGIGMGLAAAKQEALLEPIKALLSSVVPSSPLPVILLFGVAGPFLTMYRGPLNPWGLGAALIGILLTTSLPLGLIVTLAWLYDYYVAVNDPKMCIRDRRDGGRPSSGGGIGRSGGRSPLHEATPEWFGDRTEEGSLRSDRHYL